jgi:hypothetical protein
VAIITHGVLRAFGTLEDIMRMVSPLRMMEVQLSMTEQVDRVREMVKQHLEESAEVTVSPAEAVVRFRTARSDDDVGALLSLLVSAGVRVNQFREVPTDLEDTFLSLTRNVADGDGAKAAPEPAPLPR